MVLRVDNVSSGQIKKIFGTVREKGNLRIRTNIERRTIYEDIDVMIDIKIQRLE